MLGVFQPPDTHDHLLGHPRAAVVACSAASEIVEEEPGQPRRLCTPRSRWPGSRELRARCGETRRGIRGRGAPTDAPRARGVAHEHERQRLLILRDGAWQAHTPTGDCAVLDAEREPGPLRTEHVAAPETPPLGKFD